MKVPYVNLPLQYQGIKSEVLRAVEGILDSGAFILGNEVKELEASFAKACDTQYAVGVANGTDALVLSMKALGIGAGDQVITAPNSYLASGSSIALTGATPVFVDVREDYNLDPSLLEQAITEKTKAIMPVHLTGRPADMDAINAVAQAHGLFVVEDAAQAIGAEYKGRRVGSLGDFGCFSLHPLKNLSAPGDAGMITTNNEEHYNYLLKARTHGHINRDEVAFFSLNSRLDSLHAAILNVKFKSVDAWNERRRAIAQRYQEAFGDKFWVPRDSKDEKAVYHTFIIQTDQRDELQQYLSNHGVDTKVHYPIPIHLQQAASYLGYQPGDFPVTETQCEQILSLPVFPELTEEQIDYVCKLIQDF